MDCITFHENYKKDNSFTVINSSLSPVDKTLLFVLVYKPKRKNKRPLPSQKGNRVELLYHKCYFKNIAFVTSFS